MSSSSDSIRVLKSNILQLQKDNERKEKRIETLRVINKTLNKALAKTKQTVGETANKSVIYVRSLPTFWERLKFWKK